MAGKIQKNIRSAFRVAGRNAVPHPDYESYGELKSSLGSPPSSDSFIAFERQDSRPGCQDRTVSGHFFAGFVWVRRLGRWMDLNLSCCRG
ncbi:hypothetical protein WA026_013620 [Henosepilachna vigintioctopunctata]|uniref:Uncharacterized protein n=1 Tax=Henosepilachna vigintioctopunctata TaxID=420089 RepID=A0AAW1UXF4_9CUCU